MHHPRFCRCLGRHIAAIASVFRYVQGAVISTLNAQVSLGMYSRLHARYTIVIRYDTGTVINSVNAHVSYTRQHSECKDFFRYVQGTYIQTTDTQLSFCMYGSLVSTVNAQVSSGMY